jgi:hypothetical protein
VVDRLRALPDSDVLLAEAVARAPVVVGVAGLEEAPEGEPDVAPAGGARAPVRVRGGDPMPRLRRFAGTLRSLPVIDAAARGHGLLNVDPEAGVVRRLPLAAAVGSAVLPTFAVELLRVGQGVPGWGLRVGRRGVEAVDVGPVVLPTQPDGSLRVLSAQVQRSCQKKLCNTAPSTASAVAQR